MWLSIIRFAYGTALIAILFLPFGIYHTMTEPYVAGALWGFMLPIGHVAAVSGITVIFYSTSNILQKLNFGYLLIFIGFALLFSTLFFPRELSVSLLHGTNMIDIDYSIFTGAVFWLSILNILSGIVVRITKSLQINNRTLI